MDPWWPITVHSILRGLIALEKPHRPHRQKVVLLCSEFSQVEFVQPLRLRNTEGAWRVVVNSVHVYR